MIDTNQTYRENVLTHKEEDFCTQQHT